MEFNNKTILITGLIVCSAIAMFCNYEQIALAIVSGLVGYLSKDIVDRPVDSNSDPVVSIDDPVVLSDDPIDTEGREEI